MAFNAYYRAWNVSSNAPETGDAANHTVSVEVNGSDVTGLTETEVGSGVYRVELSDVQCPEGARFAVHGSSSTGDVQIVGETGVRPQTMRGTDSASTHSEQDVRDLFNANDFKADVSGLATSSELEQTETDIIAGVSSPSLDDIADAVWDEAQSGHSTAGTFGSFLDASISGVGGAVGSGADQVTITLEDGGGNPVADADVWISNDAAGVNVVAGTLQTDSQGEITFMLDDGVTYYRWAQKDGINFTNPESFVAEAD